MKLLRVAFISFDPKIKGHIPFSLASGDLEIVERKLREHEGTAERAQLLVVASTKLGALPVKDAGGRVIIPERERRECEELIETYANLIALAHRVGRKISSAEPPAALVAESESEVSFLNGCVGVKIAPRSQMRPHFPFAYDERILRGLQDRMDGVALFTEALSAGGGLGKYRDFIRVFELAFACGSSKLVSQLSKFLPAQRMGYSRDEVTEWYSYRDRASHADLQKSKEFALERDVSFFLERMEQAAFEVLLNKKLWHHPSPDRRDFLTQEGVTSSRDAVDLSLTKARAVNIHVRFFDDFGSYPRHLGGILTTPPREWWWKRTDKNAGSVGGSLKVVPPPAVSP
jgi:hypothetical protein